MFQNWGFLISEIVVLLVLAGLLGVIVGWLIWGRRGASQTAVARLETELDTCRAAGTEQEARISQLEAEVASARDALAFADAPAENAATAQVKPTTLDQARDDAPDDLKLIKGVGPKLEALCNELGFYHFDQIAAWSPAEVAWVDENLEGFKGRVSRDNWVEQAKILAAGGSTEFSEKAARDD